MEYQRNVLTQQPKNLYSVSCNQKRIKEAYHILCDPCASTKQVCAKCQQPNEILPSSGGKTPQELLQESQNEERLRGLMTERQRRSYLRRLERGDEEGAERIRRIVEERVRREDEMDDDEDWDMDDDLDGDMSDEDGEGEGDDGDENEEEEEEE
ncbi:hypothetical protein HDU76_002582 [Blyttiomyces sp. JEL0837]|nr:hypothetical protein HDU76_002582 [Blyttiomyces sp. JEL0837]